MGDDEFQLYIYGVSQKQSDTATGNESNAPTTHEGFFNGSLIRKYFAIATTDGERIFFRGSIDCRTIRT